MNFIFELGEVFLKVLLPMSIVVLLVFLTILVWNLTLIIKEAKVTVITSQDIAEDVQYKLDLLNKPIEAVGSIGDSMDTFTSIMSKFGKWKVKSSKNEKKNKKKNN